MTLLMALCRINLGVQHQLLHGKKGSTLLFVENLQKLSILQLWFTQNIISLFAAYPKSTLVLITFVVHATTIHDIKPKI